MGLISLTSQELARFDGKFGRPAYIAYEGVIYDVTASYTWRGGNHLVFHNAGGDLTTAMKDAPHGEDLLRKFPIVGKLRDRQAMKEE